jgi:HK97 family phage major capsid protein
MITQGEKYTRTGTLSANKDNKIELSFSSTTPVERGGYYEVLEHTPNAVNLSRLNAKANVLFNHDSNAIVGVVERAYLGGNKGKAEIRISKNRQDIRDDILDGIITNISVGYIVESVKREERTINNMPVYRVAKWTPYEISLVSVPADTSVGVNRSAQKEENKEVKIAMDNLEVKDIKKREKEISDMIFVAQKYKVDEGTVRGFIESGKSLEALNRHILDSMPTPKPIQTSADLYGVTHDNKRGYSIVRAIAGIIDNKIDNGYEREVSREIERQTGRGTRGGIIIPMHALRTLLTSDAEQAGNLVGSELLAGRMGEYKHNLPVVVMAGATVLSDLVGDVIIPYQSSTGNVSWVAENNAASGSALRVKRITLSPKTVTGNTSYSRKLMLQSTPAIEQLIRNDFTNLINNAIDVVAINGGGSNEPSGILQTSGIGDVTTSGTLSYAKVLELEEDIISANALKGNLAFIATPGVRKNLRSTFTNSTYGEIPLWTSNPDGTGNILGYKAFATNNVPSNISGKHAIIFGNFSELLIGQWGGVDVIVDPYTNSTTGEVRVTIFCDVDVGVRHAGSFSAAKDITVS